MTSRRGRRPARRAPLPKWGGRKAQAWSRAVLARYGNACALQLDGCLGIATTGDHIIPRVKRPDLQYDVTNGQPACQPCNSRKYDGRDTPTIVDELNLLRDSHPRGRDTDQSPPRTSRKDES